MKRALALAFALALAGCALEQAEERAEAPRSEPKAKPKLAEKPVRVVVPEPKVSPMETLLADFERLRRSNAADLAREQETARQEFARTRSDAARVQLAMSLSVTGAPTSDELRALELLEPLVRNPALELHGLAFVLATHIQEQRRLTGQLQTIQQSNQTLQQNVQALQQNVQALQQKLDALRTLERSMTERGEPAPARKK